MRDSGYLLVILMSLTAIVGLAQASSQRVLDIQICLTEKGFDSGPIDGIDGRKTRQATPEFQEKNLMPLSGEHSYSASQEFLTAGVFQFQLPDGFVPVSIEQRDALVRSMQKGGAQLSSSSGLGDASKYLPGDLTAFEWQDYLIVFSSSTESSSITSEYLEKQTRTRVDWAKRSGSLSPDSQVHRTSAVAGLPTIVARLEFPERSGEMHTFDIIDPEHSEHRHSISVIRQTGPIDATIEEAFIHSLEIAR